MSDIERQREEQALSWLVMTNDPEFDGWDEFTEWLEQDPANAGAYHRLADAELSLQPLVEQSARPAMTPLSVTEPRQRRKVLTRRSALAFTGFGVLALATMTFDRLQPVEHSTRPGEQRTLALGGSDRLVLNGGTKLALAGFDKRSIRLERGEVLLLLHGKAAAPVSVEVGDLELVDVGTVFSVTREARATRVIVAEGEVIADPSGAKLRLGRGTRLDAVDGQQVLRAVATDPSAIGAWREGQLVYNNETLAQVAADLTRSTGISLRTDGLAAAQRFTGTLSIDAIRRDPRSIEPLFGVSLARSGDAWIIRGAGS